MKKILKNIYKIILILIKIIFGVDNAKKFDAKLRFNRSLNLKNPKTLADKVSYLELHEDNTVQAMCTDKYEVRNYIRSKGLADILIPCVGGPWRTFEEIDFNKLPNSFVLKATHGCKMNYFVIDKLKLNIEECKKNLNQWLNTTYGTYSMEPHYGLISHRLYAEEYLEDMSNLIDYKFHCINGKPMFILTVSERNVENGKSMEAVLNLFDTAWNHLDKLVSSNKEKPGNGDIDKPEHLSEMLEIARALSEDFKFVRVDLYEIKGKIYFGELTFSPACCVFPYFTDDFLDEMGKILKI